ncbi:MAG: M16 family metallopeptidase [Microcystaceae cyanobacterium]
MNSTLLPLPALNAPILHTLPNGLTIIAEQMPVEAVSFNLWLKVGSVQEEDNINGMAHFLEHMVFKGTPKLESGGFEKAIEERGAVTNAATSQEYTQYYITTAPKDFLTLAPLQLEVVLNASIPENPFERERGVVLEEIRRSQDNPQRRIFTEALKLGFDQLPYARPVLGETEIIEALQPQQMRDFHAQWYQPGRMTAVVVGNLPPLTLIESVAKGFSQSYTIKSPSQLLESPPLVCSHPFTEIISQEAVDPTLQQSRLLMLWRVPGLENLATTQALDVLSVILGKGKVSRLFRELREEKGLVNTIGVSNMTQSEQGLFYILAQLPSENIEKVERAILDQIQQIQNLSITDAELNRIRTQVANRFIMGNERPSDRANLYGYYYSQLRSLEPALQYPAQIQALTAKDIQQVAQQYLPTNAYGRLVFRPE